MNASSIDRIFNSGRPAVGYLCTATPPEIIFASGGFPFRLTGDGENLGSAETLAHPNLCGFCKSALAWAMALPPGRSIVAVNASSCDGCRRLGPLLETLPTVRAAIPLDLPRTAEPKDAEFFGLQLRRLHKTLAELLGGKADEGRLAEAIAAYGAARRGLRRVLYEVYDGRLPVEAAFHATEDYFTMMPDEFPARAGEILAQAAAKPDVADGPRMILAGNITLGPGLARTIADAGARVVGLDLCNVERATMIEVNESGDPYAALVRAIYDRPMCPRCEPGLDWANRLGQRARDVDADAVVLFSLKFCDNTLYELPMVRRHLEGLGLSVLALDGEYASVTPGQVVTRVEAFIETL